VNLLLTKVAQKYQHKYYTALVTVRLFS